jgi:two-component system cell cycle response regulator
MTKKRGIKVLVYQKGADAKNFLQVFFKKKKDLQPAFASTSTELKSLARKEQYDVMIVEAPNGTKDLSALTEPPPTIALITDDLPKGLKSVVKCNIDCYVTSPYHEDDLYFKIKSAIEHKSWFRRLYSEKKDLEAIIELTYLISSTLDPKEVLYLVVRKISEMIDVSRCSIISVGYGEKRYAQVVSSFEDPTIQDIKLDLRKYPEIRKALKSKKPLVVNDALKDPLMKSVREKIKPLGIQSIAVIPIIHRDEVIGTLFLRTSKTGKSFSEREIKLCNAIANASSNALYNAYLFERLENEKSRLEKLAITDYLTGVYNIRYFYNRLEEEFSRAIRYEIPISCIMLDIDRFKRINDNYGHRAGDLVLRQFAQLIRRHTRKSDVFARYGGEEFIILLPQTGVDGAKTEAERLQKYIREHHFKNIEEKITSSMGIACWPTHNIDTSDDLITLADHALYRAKAMGRDRIVISRRIRKQAPQK